MGRPNDRDPARAPDRRGGTLPQTRARRPSREGPCDPRVEAECRRVADFLLELARSGEVDAALTLILDALDDGMAELEPRANRRAEKVYQTFFENRITAQERRLQGQGVDPYFWG